MREPQGCPVAGWSQFAVSLFVVSGKIKELGGAAKPIKVAESISKYRDSP